MSESTSTPDVAAVRDDAGCGRGGGGLVPVALGTVCQNLFVRFLLVGALNTAFGYAVFALFIWLGLHYSLAALLGTVCGVIFNFRTTGTLVFNNSDPMLIFRFVGVYSVLYGLNVAALKAFLWVGLGPLLAGAVLLLPMALLGFALNRRWVFGGSAPRRSQRNAQPRYH